MNEWGTPIAPAPAPAPVPTNVRDTAWYLRMLLVLLIGGTLAGGLVVGGIFFYFSRGLPNIITVEDYRPLTVTRIFAKGENEEPLVVGEFYKERRYLVPYEKIPEVVVQAFISAEDDQFFNHPGINIASMIRAGIANFRAGHVVQGGSTITQQVAKSLLLTPERSFVRKIREVILASRIESHLTKQQILYLYLNQIYLGHGSYGVQAAAQTYFRKDVSDLNTAEAALLAGLPQAPSKYSPLINPQKAKERQRYVLRRMAANKFIGPVQLNDSMAAVVRLFHDEDVNIKYAPHLIEHVRRYLLEKYGEKAVYENGYTVTLPTSVALLKAARKSLQEGLEEADKRGGFRGALRNLKTPAEIEDFLREGRAKLILRKLQFEVLLPDGRLDTFESMGEAGITNETSLLTIGDKYQAVVASVDDKRKVATVMIGLVRGEIPMSQMTWAEPGRTIPSRILNKGDVVLVKPVSVNDKSVIMSLEQEPQVQGALYSLDAKTGAVLAMEGGYDFSKSEFNRAVQGQRQPGSSFKPIIFGAALEKGFNPATVILDSPIVYEDADSGKWKPSNFEEKFYGDTTFRQALIKSRNVPTIKIVQAIQVPFLLDYTKRIGLNGQFNPDLSISLGSGALSLAELTKAYALYPRLGRKIKPVVLLQVSDRDGKVVEENKFQPLPEIPAVPIPEASPAEPVAYPLANDPDQVMDPRVAYVMTHIMTEVVAYGTGHAAQTLGRPAAGKTGTTNEYLDAWFMGFTPHVVTGVWVGHDSLQPIGKGETGAKAALPIWLKYMREAVKGYPNEGFQVPPGVVFATIDSVTGKLARPNSSTAIKEAFVEGTQPTETTGKSGVSTESQSEFFKEDLE